MPDEESKKQGGETCPEEAKGIEVRPRSWLVPVIPLSLREWNSYGYKLMEHAAAFGYQAMNSGTFYRILRNMEKDGLCESEWDTTSGGGPARRVYSITDAGVACLTFWAKSLEDYQRHTDAFLQLYTGRPTRRISTKMTDRGSEQREAHKPVTGRSASRGSG